MSMTRVGRGSAGRRRRFSVDFSGDMLGDNPPVDPKPALTVAPGSVQNLRVWSYPDRRLFASRSSLTQATKTRVRCVLSSKSAEPISETWLYRWTP